MKTISLCMIVKDAEKYIEECISSVFPIVTEIIIVDTGSTDSTLERIKRFNPKVYHHKWNNNFAEARNFSLQHATSDYTIVLDADEAVFAEDLNKLAAAINGYDADCLAIRFYNFTDEDENAFNIHEGLRIFKTGSYHFVGAIHEQPEFTIKTREPVIKYTDVRVKHYGYMKSNVGEKKFNRNMTILKEVLEKNPDEPFHLFNMGNQYMSIGEYETALTYFEKADRLKDINLAYSPHLFFRRATCLKSLNRGDECLEVIADGLRTYPACTDMEFLRGQTLSGMRRYSLALESFDRCLKMGMAPTNLCFFVDTATVRPYIEIAFIFEQMEDYEKALGNYLKALQQDGKRYYLIYRVASMLNKIYRDKDIVFKNLCNIFADYTHKPNVMVMTDAMLDDRLTEQAAVSLKSYLNKADTDGDVRFLKGRYKFYSGKIDEAFADFHSVFAPDAKRGILPKVNERALEYMCACTLISDNCLADFLHFLSTLDDSTEKSVCLSFLNIRKAELETTAQIPIASVLSKLLAVKEFEKFEKALQVLNLVEGKEALIALAEVYYLNNYHDLAQKTLLESLKQLDNFNVRALMLLNKVI